jgi:hypothetical protein
MENDMNNDQLYFYNRGFNDCLAKFLNTPPAKTLTEGEMKECWEEATEGREHFCSQYFDFAQLILKKASEK